MESRDSGGTKSVHVSGLYSVDCRDWNRKATGIKDWATFNTHFAQTFKEVQESL